MQIHPRRSNRKKQTSKVGLIFWFFGIILHNLLVYCIMRLLKYFVIHCLLVNFLYHRFILLLFKLFIYHYFYFLKMVNIFRFNKIGRSFIIYNFFLFWCLQVMCKAGVYTFSCICQFFLLP